MESFVDSISQEIKAFSLLEWFAVIPAIVYVILAAKANRWCFLFGLISSVIYIYIATTLRFYFDTAINIYYVFMSFYGWYSWSKTENSKEIPISQMPKNRLHVLLISSALVTLFLAFGVDRYSNAALPYLDAFTTIFAIVATWMVVKKYIENWLVWIIVDLIASAMYAYKGLFLTSMLYAIYTIIAIIGYQKWKQQIEYSK